jgi:hypothetical protein
VLVVGAEEEGRRLACGERGKGVPSGFLRQTQSRKVCERERKRKREDTAK